jgi:hypothetical protein
MTSLYDQFKSHSQEDLDNAFICACDEGDITKAKYLLTSEELKKNANIHAQNDLAFHICCLHMHNKKKNLKILDFLVTSSELEENVSIHAIDDFAFHRALVFEAFEILHHFIFDLNIDRTPKINKYLSDHPNKKIESLFALRDLNEKLNNELSSDNISNNSKKIKI